MKAITGFLWVALGATAAITAACDGGGGDALQTPGNGNGDNGAAANPNANAPIPEGTTLGQAGLRRLTNREYEAVVRDTFGLAAEWKGPALTADPKSDLGFDNAANLLEIDDNRSGELVASGESAADAVLSAKKLGSIAACSTLTRDCAAAVVDTWGAKLFRRAVTDEEKARYLSLYDDLVTQGATDPIKWVLVALLDSPTFLYRSEVGENAGNGRIALTGEEIATELAFTFGGTSPSDELLAKGRSGALFADDARITEARNLLQTPRGHEVLAEFMRQWLRYAEVNEIVKDEAVVPNFSVLRGDMKEETRRFLDNVIFTKQGTLKDLFTTRDTFVTPALATHYGLGAPGADGVAQRPEEQSAGILSQGSILSRYGLASASSPSQRGAFVRRRLLCQPLPPPPPNAGEPPVPQDGLTTRELYEKVHATQPSCAGCHGLIDPVGFGLEHFDVAGRYRTTERTKTIDSTGHISGLDGKDPSFTDHRTLGSTLAASPQVADCVTGLLSSYAFGSSDGASFPLPDTKTQARAGTISLLELYARLAAAPSFTLRKGT